MPRSNETEQLLRSGRADDAAVPLLPPGSGTRRAEQAVRQAAARLTEAHRVLSAYRDSPESDLAEAYVAVHAARSDLAAARHWRALEAMVEDMRSR